MEIRGDDPVGVFERWYADAVAAEIPQPDAVCLATATRDGVPSARMVLYKGIEGGRLRFFTNYGSRKAMELDSNPRAALVFWWEPLKRQVRLEGRVFRLPAEASDRYFLTRTRGSRLGAWASAQSSPIGDRAELLRRFAEVEARFEGREVTRPEFWGGYALDPARVEFWSGRDDRLHDRVCFRREPAGWERFLLQP